MTSVNSYILQNSRKYYKTDTICNIVLVIVSIPINYYFVKWWGMIGAGLVSLALSSVLNSFKALFLYFKEKIHPFSKKWLPLLCTFLLTLAVGFFAELAFRLLFLNHAHLTVIALIAKISLKGILLCLVFIPLIYRLKISEDINITIRNILNQLSLILHKLHFKKSNS